MIIFPNLPTSHSYYHWSGGFPVVPSKSCCSPSRSPKLPLTWMILASQQVSHSQTKPTDSSKHMALVKSRFHETIQHTSCISDRAIWEQEISQPCPTQVFIQEATAGTMKDKATLDVGSVTNLTSKTKQMRVITGTSAVTIKRYGWWTKYIKIHGVIQLGCFFSFTFYPKEPTTLKGFWLGRCLANK